MTNTLKMKPEHYDYLKEQIKARVEAARQHRTYLESEGNIADLEKRLRWDLMYSVPLLSRWISDNLYPYLHDNHIDSAMKQIIKELKI